MLADGATFAVQIRRLTSLFDTSESDENHVRAQAMQPL